MKDELGILKEVGSIAAGHGAMALSEILGRKINLTVPSSNIIACQQIPKSMRLQKTGMGVYTKLLVGLRGEVAFVLDEKNIFKLVELSYKINSEDKRPGIITEIGLSLIKEVGSVVIGSYLNALSLVLRRIIIPPIPTLVSGSIDEILNVILSAYTGEDYSYLVETVFEVPRENLSGSFYLLLTPGTAQDISETCKRQLEQAGGSDA